MDHLIRLSHSEQVKALLVAFLLSLALCLGGQLSLVPDLIHLLSIL